MKKVNKLLTIAASVLLLVGCGSNTTSTNKQTSQNGNNTNNNRGNNNNGGNNNNSGNNNNNEFGFSFGEDITTAQKIHTDDQESFLNSGLEYYTQLKKAQLDSFNATGNDEHSFPQQVKLTWNYKAPDGKTVKFFEVQTGQEEDLSDKYTIKGTSENKISFYNAYLGTNYFKVIANLDDDTKEESDIKTFLVDEAAPRNLKVGTMSNCRDMGGRTNVSGGKIRQGLLFRTSDPANTGIGDISEWTTRFGIKTEIYVKDGGKSTGSEGPLGKSVNYYNASMDYGNSSYSNLSRNAERLRYVFSILNIESNYPAIYHCRIGTDRTGICGVMLNGILGVPFNEVIQDYAFSNFGKIDGQRYVGKTPDNNNDDIARYVDEILAMPGEDFQQKTAYALMSIGIPADHLQKIIDIMTIGNKATIPTDISVFNGENLTNNGGTKKTATDYKNPATYYEISGASKSVSCTYNANAAKSVNIVVYLGNETKSTSKKLADGIDLKIDGTSQTICDRTYEKAGFGKTSQSSRTCYMYSILGSYNLSAGNHTITIAGKNSDKFNVAGISIIG